MFFPQRMEMYDSYLASVHFLSKVMGCLVGPKGIKTTVAEIPCSARSLAVFQVKKVSFPLILAYHFLAAELALQSFLHIFQMFSLA